MYHNTTAADLLQQLRRRVLHTLFRWRFRILAVGAALFFTGTIIVWNLPWFMPVYFPQTWPPGATPIDDGLFGARAANPPGIGCPLQLGQIAPAGIATHQQWLAEIEMPDEPCRVENRLRAPAWLDYDEELLHLDLTTQPKDRRCYITYGTEYAGQPTCSIKVKVMHELKRGQVHVIPLNRRYEFVWICCGYPQRSNPDWQRQMWPIARVKPEVLDRARRFPLENPQIVAGRERFNIVYISPDALSRANMFRLMSESVDAIKQLAAGDYEVFQFFRYGVVGANTSPNRGAIVAADVLRAYDEDHAGFLWNELRNLGYVTSYGHGECPRYGLRDWQREPEADHAMATHWCAGIPASPTWRGPFMCLGDKPLTQRALNYTLQWMQEYADVPFFALLNVQDAHERTFRRAKLLDRPLAEFLRALPTLDQALRDRTVVLLAADHGLHFGGYAVAHRVGALEHRLPAMFMLVPRAITAQYPELAAALKANEQTLFTARDLYRTMIHLGSYPLEPPIKRTMPHPYDATSDSILKPLDPGRSCEGRIPATFCPCQEQFDAWFDSEPHWVT